MSVFFYAPVCFILLVLLIYLVCKVLALQQAFDKDDDDLQREAMERHLNALRQNTNRNTRRTDPRPYTISGRLPSHNGFDMETPPKYEMPPSYYEAVSCVKQDNSAVITIERG